MLRALLTVRNRFPSIVTLIAIDDLLDAELLVKIDKPIVIGVPARL